MSAEPLTEKGAWFVGLKADGGLDRDWPYDKEGREGVGIVLGDSSSVVKVIPITQAREVVQAAEERAERMRQMLVRISQWDPIARRYLVDLAADDAARGYQ